MNAEPGRRDRILAAWLFAVMGMVFVMVVLGGVTRLTHSGLSMVDWRPVSGWLPPLNMSEWQAAFTEYRKFPEYAEVNQGMTIGEFKSIFWLEFIHRLWGRTIGVAFALPLVFFVFKGWIGGALAPKLFGLFVLGGLQGGLGWYMVKSGLVERPDVSQYRLAAHFAAALAILGALLWVALDLWGRGARGTKGNKGFSLIVLGMVALTAVYGAFVAGLDAGFSYNTFPLMNGNFIPEGIFPLAPFYLNFFEDVTTVQFTHRILAETTFVLVAVFWFRAPLRAPPVNVLALAALVQVGLGVSTLLLAVPAPLAAAHQAGAVGLFLAALWVVHGLRGGEKLISAPIPGVDIRE